MKIRTKITLHVWVWLMFVALEPARAFYDPGVQRWLNRDPIHERGFQMISHPQYARQSYYDHDYVFLRNAPGGLVDPLGLMKWGKSCKQADIDALKKSFKDRCDQAKKNDCFKCLSDDGKKRMNDACDSKDGEGPAVECEDGNSTRCQTTPRGTGCGWTDKDKGKTIHVCINQAGSSACGDLGCTLLHEASHSVGGVGPDSGTLNPDKRGDQIEKCAGCP